MPLGTTNKVIAGLGSHHVAVQTRDYEAAVAFYRDVLGMRKTVEFNAGGRRICLLDIGDGSHLELFEPLPDGSSSENTGAGALFHFALATSDIESALERVRAAGMKITVEQRDAQLGGLDVTIAFFEGPSGEVIEFFQVNG